ncbi:AIR synthase-related protein [Chloroflexota bacterium]
MATLNRTASELMQEAGVNAGTDVTGFGLLGHTVGLARNSQVGINIHHASIPLLPEAGELAKQGFGPGGLHRNREYYLEAVRIEPGVPTHVQDILFDPQTSGGLLICIESRKTDLLLGRLKQNGIEEAAIIGEVVSEPKGVLTVN